MGSIFFRALQLDEGFEGDDEKASRKAHEDKGNDGKGEIEGRGGEDEEEEGDRKARKTAEGKLNVVLARHAPS